MEARPRIVATVVAAVAAFAAAAPIAEAAPQWLAFPASEVMPDTTSLASADVNSGGRVVIGLAGSTGFATAERTAGQTSLVRRQVSSSSTDQKAVLDQAGGTVAVWSHSAGVDVRTRTGDADFGPAVRLAGSDAGDPIDVATLSDGAVVVVQIDPEHGFSVKTWRRAPDSSTFTALPTLDVLGIGERTRGRPMVRPGPNGTALIGFETFTPVAFQGPVTVRGRFFVLSGTSLGPLETVAAYSHNTSFAPSSYLRVHLDDAGFLDDGTIVVPARVRYGDATHEQTVVVARRVAGTWKVTDFLDKIVARGADVQGAIGRIDLVTTGASAFAVYGWRDRYPSGAQPPAVTARVAHVSTAIVLPPVTSLGTSAAPHDGIVHAALAPNGQPLVLMTRAGTLAAQPIFGDTGAADGAPQTLLDPVAVRDAVAAGDGGAAAVVAALRGAAGDLRLVVTLRDSDAPSLEATVPARATAGEPVTLRGTASDREDLDVPIEWDTADGEPVTGTSVQMTFGKLGPQVIRVSATDDAGNLTSVTRTVKVVAKRPGPLDATETPTDEPSKSSSAPANGGPSATTTPAGAPSATTPAGGLPSTTARGTDRTAPVLSGVGLAPSRLQLRRGARTTLRWRSTEAATVLVRVERLDRGFRSGTRCLAKRPPAAAGRRARRCSRVVAVGTLRAVAAAGSGALAVTDRVARRRLGPAIYRLSVTAVDEARNISAATRVKLTVVRP